MRTRSPRDRICAPYTVNRPEGLAAEGLKKSPQSPGGVRVPFARSITSPTYSGLVPLTRDGCRPVARAADGRDCAVSAVTDGGAQMLASQTDGRDKGSKSTRR